MPITEDRILSFITSVIMAALICCAGCAPGPRRTLDVITNVESIGAVRGDRREAFGQPRNERHVIRQIRNEVPRRNDVGSDNPSRAQIIPRLETVDPDRRFKRPIVLEKPRDLHSEVAVIPVPGGNGGPRPAHRNPRDSHDIVLTAGNSSSSQDLKPPLPKSANTVTVPLKTLPGMEKVEIQASKDRISLRVREVPLNAVLSVIAEQLELNIVIASDVTNVVSVTLHDVPLKTALDSLMAISGCVLTTRDKIIYVSNITANSTADAVVQGREIRVVPLNFTAAADIEKVVKTMLSPVGKVFSLQADSADQLKTQDQIIVEDIPRNLRRILSSIAQLDQPPRQVLIEVHILQVELTDEIRHGVNFKHLAKIAGKELALSAVGFADPLAVPAAFFSMQGSKLDLLIEALKRTVNAKTLASPRVMVVNGQKAKIQIGERLGYLETTTTQTSTLQNVKFLDVGIVLEVTPKITADGRVLMYIKPKVSGGQVTDGLPSEETTEVETTVMLSDGQGIIIGGLIQEFDDDRQTKIPLLGDLWLIGRLFQFRQAKKERREIIIALIPHIVPTGAPRGPQAEVEWQRASNRLFHGPLHRNYRPGEPDLPDATRNPLRPRWDRFPRAFKNLSESHPLPADYYFPPASQNPTVRRNR